jgi:hypothetical protein
MSLPSFRQTTGSRLWGQKPESSNMNFCENIQLFRLLFRYDFIGKFKPEHKQNFANTSCQFTAFVEFENRIWVLMLRCRRCLLGSSLSFASVEDTRIDYLDLGKSHGGNRRCKKGPFGFLSLPLSFFPSPSYF